MCLLLALHCKKFHDIVRDKCDFKYIFFIKAYLCNTFAGRFIYLYLTRLFIIISLLLGWLLLIVIINKTPLGQNGRLGNTFCLLAAQASSFLIHHFPNTVRQATFGYLTLTVQHLCDLQDAMSQGAFHLTLNQGSRGFTKGSQVF